METIVDDGAIVGELEDLRMLCAVAVLFVRQVLAVSATASLLKSFASPDFVLALAT